jgi:hypothetical protein
VSAARRRRRPSAATGSSLGGSGELRCPYCGEVAEVDVDAGGAAEQDFEQDCAVCCRPWRVHLETDDDGEPVVILRREDD